MIDGKISGFGETERLVIRGGSIREVSLALGRAMKEETLRVLTKLWEGVDDEKKKKGLDEAKKKLEQLRAFVDEKRFLIEGEDRLDNFFEALEGYCEGSAISLEEGAFLQMEMEAGCQSFLVQDVETGTIRFLHSEEDIGPIFGEDSYGYKWVEMKVGTKEISFFAYPGLCGWGPAFGINKTTGMVQVVDDLIIKPTFDSGVIWANAIAFMTLDVGRIELVKEMMQQMEGIEGEKFWGGYAIHLVESGVTPLLRSLEFGVDKMKLLEPLKQGGQLVVAQDNCPLDQDIRVYSRAGYPTCESWWSEKDAQLYVEMDERLKNLRGLADLDWQDKNEQESIDMALKILADPSGNIGRYVDEKNGGYLYFSSGFPNKSMVAHFVGVIEGRDIYFLVGKERPEPIAGREYQLEVGVDYKYQLGKIWEMADEKKKEFDQKKRAMQQKYPWLFLTRPYTIDLIFDVTEDDEADERELAAGQDTMETANEIVKALKLMGHRVNLVAVNEENYKKILPELEGEVVFNQVEEDELGVEVLKELERLGKIATGVDSEGFALSWDKSKIKELLIEADVPTPKYFVVKEGEEVVNPGLEYPLFVKAADDHGSLSINENSLVKNEKELQDQVAWIMETIGGGALVEEYIDGRELGVTVLGNGEKMEVLPAKEIIFGEEFVDKPQIVTYEAKWETKSADYAGTSKMACPAELTQAEREVIDMAVRKSSEVLKVQDYARFDIRLRDGVPYIIDYNANPAIGPHDASALPAKVFGLSYPEMIAAIVAVAVGREKKK